ncbi:GNAT family N-acetyltransferase [Xenorhabdus innexi]|uniref:Putative acyl-CoA N-acyltransferase n=2 Tax=Xenorhabdus innexi TaxID=290109 RepID=A0A1N6MZV7_9GAMM|nr:GNAT family N-acetyltransferase [Xenorhabdus innexi]PHM37826.1 streptothricine-acetyl-transferase [Xenorhabdus innexi]SIP74345.1 putative acyl-CoA N-acyltransferase [Xenorhabdus innexi]
MIIRAASMQDVDDVLLLYKTLFSEMAELQPDRWKKVSQDREFIISTLRDDNFKLLVARDDNNNITGFCIAQKKQTPPFKCLVQRTYGYIIDVIVSQNVRSQGIGHKLLTEMNKWAQENNLTHLELSVLSENIAATKFYEREGYKEVNKLMAITL